MWGARRGAGGRAALHPLFPAVWRGGLRGGRQAPSPPVASAAAARQGRWKGGSVRAGPPRHRGPADRWGGGGPGARAGTSAAAGRCGGTAWQPPPPAGRPPAGGIPHRGAAGETWRAAPALAHPGGPGGGRRGARGPSPPPPSSPRSNGVWGVLCGLLMTMTLDDTPLTATSGCLSGAARHSPRETGRRSMGGAATHRPTTGHGWRGGRAGGGCCCSCQQLLGRGGAAV